MKIRIGEIMDKKFGIFIFGGGFIGGLSGLLLGAANGNLLLGWVGVLVGIFLGWFLGAINQEKQINNKK
jgi:hypothetical protein